MSKWSGKDIVTANRDRVPTKMLPVFHHIEIRASSFDCSCGIRQGSFTGSSAMRMAYQHVREAIPFRIRVDDLRHCSLECRVMADDRLGELFLPHHENCPNHKET